MNEKKVTPLDIDLGSSTGMRTGWFSCVVLTLLVLLGSIWMLEKEDLTLSSSSLISWYLCFGTVPGTIIVLGFWQKNWKKLRCITDSDRDLCFFSKKTSLVLKKNSQINEERYRTIEFGSKLNEESIFIFTREEGVGIEEGSRGGMSLRLMMIDLLLDVFRFVFWSSSIFSLS